MDEYSILIISILIAEMDMSGGLIAQMDMSGGLMVGRNYSDRN